ncbi:MULTISPECIES: YggT family protein [Kocuria]|uniref:YggT family protein n=1 Tax=Kocuria TaxID=57493 RepID=UPI000A66C314|nr:MULTISPECIES: YggT family protein [Kocuria]MCT1368453.1 YggT family protein [Rothia sp. p3-SID1597]RUQ20492.1 YggT family protein [Kocuria sp. HSID16901]
MISALAIIHFALYLAFLVLMFRLILDWVQTFARFWKPQGVALIFASTVYTMTDPPMRLMRKWIPPLRIGTVSLDMGFLVLLVVLSIAQSIVRASLASGVS